MADAKLYAADLRVELYATTQVDAKATLEEICERLFGQEHIVTIVVPESTSIQKVRS